MQQVVYLDVYFTFNFLMDFLILYMVKKITFDQKKIWWQIAGAAAGAVYACMSLLCFENFFITYFFMAAFMVFISFEYNGIRALGKNVILLYVVTLVTNGGINLIYERFAGIRAWQVILLAGGIAKFGTLGLDFVRKRRIPSRDKCVVELSFMGKSVSLMALIDTGNSLADPISSKPVSIIEEVTAKKLGISNLYNLDNYEIHKLKTERKFEFASGFRVIPYHSIGKCGTMPAYIMDSLKITKGKKDLLIISPVIAISRRKLSANGEYNMILHPKLISQEGRI